MDFDQLVQAFQKLQRAFLDHRHTGLDSKRLRLEDFGGEPSTLTPASTSTIDSTYDGTEQGVIENTRLRVNEIEAALKKFGILK